MTTSGHKHRKTDLRRRRYDAIVVGGGSGGIGAALAAARLGLEVLLIEQRDTLGGASTLGGVNCWEPGVGGTGIPFDLYRRMKAMPGAVGVYSFGRNSAWPEGADSPPFPGGEQLIDPRRRYADTLQRHGTRGLSLDGAVCRERWHGVVFEPYRLAEAAEILLAETGRGEIAQLTMVVGAQTNHGQVTALELSDGRTVVADTYIDATADAALAGMCGCQRVTGREARRQYEEPSAPEKASAQVNGVTLVYRVARRERFGIDPLPAGVPAECWWREGFIAAACNQYPNGDFNINMLPTMEGAEFMRLGGAAAYAECRRRIAAHWHHYQTVWPEFRGYGMVWTAPFLGIRETHRIIGEYVLNEADLRRGLSQQSHEDIIALADHALDTHGASSAGCGELAEPYGIPYRCLIPQGFRNLLVACRGSSFSAVAASSCRLSRTMMQLGQATGTAAFLAKQNHGPVASVSPADLRAALVAQHVQLTWPMPAEIRGRIEKE